MTIQLAHNRIAIVGKIFSQVRDDQDADLYTAAVDASKFAEIMAIVSLTGANSASVTPVSLVVTNEETPDPGDWVVLKSLTQATTTAGASPSINVLQARTTEMVVSGVEYRYIGLAFSTEVVAGVTVEATILGVGARYEPATDYDLASVIQIVQ